jgi:hypothetical protein
VRSGKEKEERSSGEGREKGIKRKRESKKTNNY